MTAPHLRRLLGLALTLALAFATSGAAVAHRLASGGPEEAALNAYLAMGGRLADLCGGEPASKTHCEACRQFGPAAPPEPSALAVAWDIVLPAHRIFSAAAPPALRDARPNPARGPPGVERPVR